MVTKERGVTPSDHNKKGGNEPNTKNGTDSVCTDERAFNILQVMALSLMKVAMGSMSSISSVRFG